MKADNLITKYFTDYEKPASWTVNEDALPWLNEIEFTIFDTIKRHTLSSTDSTEYSPITAENIETYDMLAPDVYANIYYTYLLSQTCLKIDEIDRYNNAVAIHNARLAEYAAYYRRNNVPNYSRIKV